MGNLVQIEKFHSDELSEQANEFINMYRYRWNNFLVQTQIAVRNGDQQLLDEAIGKLCPYLEREENPKELWEELWTWLVKSNRGRWNKK